MKERGTQHESAAITIDLSWKRATWQVTRPPCLISFLTGLTHRPPKQGTPPHPPPNAVHAAHLCGSAPFANTVLTCSWTVKVTPFVCDSSPSFSCRISRLCIERASERIRLASVRTPAATNTSVQPVRENESMCVANKPVFECSLSGPCFDLSSGCQLAAMFVYPAR